MNDREYRRLKHQIEAEYQQKIHALEMVWTMANRARRNETGVRSDRPRKGALLALVRNVLPQMRGEFTQHTVLEKLRENNQTMDIKRASMSATLRKLSDDGEIELLELGSGKRPSRYRVKQLVRA